MLDQSLFYGTVIGPIVGLVWSFGLNIEFSTCIPIGAIIGLIVGLGLVFFGKAARAGVNITTGETLFVSTAFLTFLIDNWHTLCLDMLYGVLQMESQ